MKEIIAFLRIISLAFIILQLLFTQFLLYVFTSITLQKLQLTKLAQINLHYHCKMICFVLGINISCTNLPKSTPVNFLLLSNHISYLDIIVLSSIYPLSYVAKKDIMDWPVLGALVRLCGTLFVHRDCVIDRSRVLRKLKKKLKENSFCVFPEGTTTYKVCPDQETWHDGNLWAAHNQTVLAAGITYHDQDQIAWVGDDELLAHLWRLCKRTDTNVYISMDEYHFKNQASPSFRKESKNIHSFITSLCMESYHRMQQENDYISIYNTVSYESNS